MLRLRPYKACDAKTIISWIKDETAFRKWCADRFEFYPITADDLNAHYDATAYSDTFFPFTAFDESGVVGHMIMRFTDNDKKTVRFGFVIVDDSKRGKGLGKEMLTLAIKYAFDILKAERITLGVFDNNAQAFGCYKSVGFEEVHTGEAERYYVLGEVWKCREMQLDGK